MHFVEREFQKLQRELINFTGEDKPIALNREFKNFVHIISGMPKVQKISDTSNFLSRRIYVTIENGYSISIVQGVGTFGLSYGLFEIALLNDQGSLIDTPCGKDVLGYQSFDEVLEFVHLISKKNQG